MRDGRLLGRSVKSEGDLLPPKVTRDEAIAECLRAYYDGPKMVSSVTAMSDAITHWEKLKAEGRIDE
jgi:hypothetical protein